MRKISLIFFILAISFSLPIEKQIARDPEALDTFMKMLVDVPRFSLESANLSGEAKLEYMKYASIIAKLNSKSKDLLDIYIDLSKERESFLNKILNFVGFYSSEAVVKEGIKEYNEWILLYEKLCNLSAQRLLHSFDEEYALSNFSSFFSVDGISYSQLVYEARLVDSTEQKTKKIPRELENPAVAGVYLYFVRNNTKHYIDVVPEYLLYTTFSASLIGLAPNPVTLNYILSHNPFIRIEKVKKEFVSRKDLLHILGNSTIDSGKGKEIEGFVNHLVKFKRGAEIAVEERRKKTFMLYESLLAKKREIAQISSYFNSSIVQRAMEIANPSAKGISATLPEEKLDLSEIEKMIYFHGKLGEEFSKLGDAQKSIVVVNDILDEKNASLYSSFFSIVDSCRSYRKKLGIYNVSCEYSSIRDVEKVSSSLLFLHSQYLARIGREREGIEEYREVLLEKVEDLRRKLRRVSRFLDLDFVLSKDKEISILEKEILNSSSFEELKKKENKINDIDDNIRYEFIRENYEKALKMQEKLRRLYSIAKNIGLNVTVPGALLLDIYPTSDGFSSILYILNNEDKIEQLEALLLYYKQKISSNLPTEINCTPVYPPLGVNFDVSCSIFVKSPWPEELKEAFSTVSLPYPCNHIDSRNVVFGDLSNVESVNCFSRDLKIKWKNVRNESVLLKYSSHLPPARISKVNESSKVDFYSVTYLIAANCSSKSYAIMKHPFFMHRMNSTLPYFLYNSTHIAVLIDCNLPNFVTFSGRPYAVEKEGKRIRIKKIVNTSLPLFVTVEKLNKVNVSYSLADKPVLMLSDEMVLEGDVKGNKLDDASSFKLENISIKPWEKYGINATSIKEAAYMALKELYPGEIGCVPENILKEVSARFYVPKPRCTKLNFENYRKAKEAFESGNYTKVLEIYSKRDRADAYLLFASKYKSDAEIAIGELAGILNNPIAKRIAGRYLELAKEAYYRGDYISAIYYAKYGILKAPLNLETPLRILVAILIIGVGIFLSRRKEEEELI